MSKDLITPVFHLKNRTILIRPFFHFKTQGNYRNNDRSYKKAVEFVKAGVRARLNFIFNLTHSHPDITDICTVDGGDCGDNCAGIPARMLKL